MRASFAAFFAVLLTLASPGSAAVLIDTGPAGQKEGWNVDASQSLAVQLSETAAFEINDIEGWFLPITSGQIRISVFSEFGALPGSMIFSDTVALPSGPDAANWYGIHGLAWTFDAGTYWIVYSAVGETYAQMPYPSLAPVPNEAFTARGVWAPTTIRVGVRVNGGIIGTPEPGTWAMMLMGFGGIGIAVRRQKRSKSSVQI